MMKLLASDFDGTLLMHEKDKSYIKENDKQAIKQFQKDGNLFGICTGRGLEGLLSWSEDIQYDFYILNSGAIILDKNLKEIQRRYIDISLAKEIINFVSEDAFYSFVVDGKMYVQNPNHFFPKNIIRVQSIDDIPSQKLDGFSVHFKDDIDKTTHVIQKIKKQFACRIAAYQNIDNIDMVAYGCSKGNGIRMIQKYFQLSNQDIFVIGDSWNDIPMFEACDNPMTFDRSEKDVQEKAKYIVKDIKECITMIQTSYQR